MKIKSLLLSVLLLSMAWSSSEAQVLTDFYSYDNGKVSLTATFKEQLNRASGGELKSGTYIWKTGDALPNPNPNGTVTDMDSLFLDCEALTTLDLSSFNTASVTDMVWMFFGCNALTTLDLSSFNTASVTSMVGMFAYCTALTTLDLSKFNTSSVTSMNGMFEYCNALTTLDLSSFNTAKVVNMFEMFSGCTSLKQLNIYNFSILAGDGISKRSDLDLDGMFNNCGFTDNNGNHGWGMIKNYKAVQILNDKAVTGIDSARFMFHDPNDPTDPNAGVNGVNSDNTLKVYGTTGAICIETSAPVTVAIYSTAGVLIRSNRLSEGTQINVAQGFYLVKANGNTYKVQVK